MKFLKLYWKKLLVVALVLYIVTYSFSFGIIACLKSAMYKENVENLKIYYVVHVETFEGGGKSRLEFLKSISKRIEKENPNVLFLIKTVNPANLETELNSNQVDLVSFGFGVGNVVLKYLSTIDETFDVQEKLVYSATFSNKIYALPFIMSGYAMITHGAITDDFVCGENEYVSPRNIYSNLNLTPSKTLTQYEAYKYFVNNRSATLLGTSRDVYRINNLISIGRLTASISPIDSYTDLIQYIGKTNTDKYIDYFLELTLSNEFQTKLCDYSLFSCLKSKIYSSGIYGEMEDAIIKSSVPKVFYD